MIPTLSGNLNLKFYYALLIHQKPMNTKLPGEEFDSTVWWMIKEIEKEFFTDKESNLIALYFDKSKNSDHDLRDQKRALRFLENEDAIKVKENIREKGNVLHLHPLNSRDVIGKKLMVNDEAFAEVKEKFFRRISESDNFKNKEYTSITEQMNKVSEPLTFTENGVGYLRFGKEGSKIKIGGEDTKKFQFLDRLIENYGKRQKVIRVVRDIWGEHFDSDEQLKSNDPEIRYERARELAKNSGVKELQKISGLNPLKFEFDDQDRMVWVEIED